MRKKLMFGVVLGFLMFLSGISAHAQDMSRYSVTGGYNFLFGHPSDDVSRGYHGYFLTGVYNINDHVGFEMEFTGNNGTKLIFEDADTNSLERRFESVDKYTYLFGPVFRTAVPSMSNLSLYGHALAGGAHFHVSSADSCCTPTSPLITDFSGKSDGFAMKVGGGLRWDSGRWGIRIAGFDYVHGGGQFTENSCFSASSTCKYQQTFSGVEVTTGITLNFGSR